MTEITKQWLEAFEGGVGCGSCGAPMMTVENEDNPNTGSYICILCTWAEDHYQIGFQEGRKLQHYKLQDRIAALENALMACNQGGGAPWAGS